MADRFFLPGPYRSEVARLEGDEARHLARVARKQIGDVVEIFDGEGQGRRVRVETIDRDGVELRLLDEVPDRRWPVDLTLAVAFPKGERVDWLIEKAAEIGVMTLVPIRSARSVVDPRVGKLDRLRRVIVEASKQSGRNRLMTLAEPIGFETFLAQDRSTVRLIAQQGGLPPRSWPSAASNLSAALLVGPEGGWTDAERASAASSGWTRINLGPTRLRIETAAIIGAATYLGLYETEATPS